MKNLFFALILCSCSHMSTPRLSDQEEQFPNWVYAPYDFCSESRELCASGEGPNFSTSDQEAKSNLASIFKVHIASTLQSSITQENSFHQMELKVKSQANQSLQASVDEVLEAVQITKRFQRDGVSYSLAKLDRDSATAILNQRIDRIDQELLTYWNKQQRTLVRKMLRLSAERSSIEEKLAILTPVFKPAPVSYQQIMEWALTPTKPQLVSLKVAHSPKWLVSKLSSLLTEVGYKVSDKEGKSIISVNVTSIKEFLNVEGFEKFTFTLNIMHIQNGDKIGHLTKVETVVGRNQEDALLKIKNSFVEYLEDQLYNLNLD